jgi:HSP20 family protein
MALIPKKGIVLTEVTIMAIQKWAPFRDLRREMDDLFEKFFSEERLPAKRWADVAPALDLKVTDNEVIVTAELPGVEPKDMNISLEGDTLTIKGEKKQEKEEKNENMVRVERSYGTFQRSISLPCKVDENKIAADFKNGVLRVTLPKTEAARKKSIKINVS